MDLDCPRESESMSMDIDDGAVSCRCDSVEMDPSSSSGGRMFDFHPQTHQIAGSVQASTHSFPSRPLPDCEHLPGSDDSPQFMVLSLPTSPVNRLGETGDIYQNSRLARQRRDLLPSEQEVAPRKRKRTQDLPHMHMTDHDHIPRDDAFTDGANPQSHRRTRPRLRKQQDGEFSPLLIMSPGRERDSPVEEETISAFHHPPNATDLSHSIRRYFPEHGPRILQSSSSPKFDGLDDLQERGRADSADSFTEVALASTVTRKHGRLSTLQDFWLPRPFEEAERPSLGPIKVHERGLDAPPLFLSTSGGRMGGLWASRESAGSPTDALGHPIRAPVREHGIRVVSPRFAMLPLEPSSTNFFDKPICDSPDPIDPDEDGLVHSEPLATAQGARIDSTPRG